MLNNQQFYNEILKKYVVIFGTLFNNIQVSRSDGTDTTQTFKVPLSYGPKEKALSRIDAEPETLEREVAIRLPRMSFEMTSMSYASTRKMNSRNTFNTTNVSVGSGTYGKVLEPVPYDLNFQLSIVSKTVEDANQILEQIVPWFGPEYTVSFNPLKDNIPNLTRDVQIILTSAISEDTYEGDYETRRALIWTLDFIVKAYFYGPTGEAKVIKLVNVDMYAGDTDDADGDTVTVQPGLTANGEPTSNSAETISYLQIDEDDDYGYIVTITGIDQ